MSRPRLRTAAATVASVAVALALSALLVQVTGGSPSAAVSAMYRGSLDGGASVGQTVDEATPLLLVALGTLISTRAGIFNIGQEGQLLIGATSGAAVGLHAGGLGTLGLVATLAAAAAGGAAWAGVAAVLRYWRSVDVVISTLLLSFIAVQLVTVAVNRSWLLQERPVAGAILLPESDALPPDVHLPRIGQYPSFNAGAGFVLALLLAVVVALGLTRTVWGLRLRMLGLNRVVAHRVGVDERRTGAVALLLSGAFAGLAGGVVLTGTVFRLQPAISDNLGNEGLLVALVGQAGAVAAVPIAFFFGALRSGGSFLAATGVPRFLVDVVQGLLVLAAVTPAALRLRRRAPGRELAPPAPWAADTPGSA